MHKYLIFISCLLLFTASKCEKNKNCTEVGTLKDFTGLDGCKFMIVLDNGEKLQPVKYEDADVELKDGQRIKFGYKEVTDQMSICMAGKMVEITCFEYTNESPVTGTDPVRLPCLKTLDPYEAEWGKMAMQKTNAYQVVRYTYRTDGWAYLFNGPQKNMIVDCQGTVICECGAKETKCDDQVKNYSNELVIWEKD
ncbi:MAG: hypothetical protein AAF573_20900 [Bacteroidota bacterium]